MGVKHYTNRMPYVAANIFDIQETLEAFLTYSRMP